MYTMSVELCELIENTAYEIGDIKIRNDYSGRGMYGETCFALCGREECVSRLIRSVQKEAARLDEDIHHEFFDLQENACYDSMGKSIVMYFPHISWNTDVNIEHLD